MYACVGYMLIYRHTQTLRHSDTSTHTHTHTHTLTHRFGGFLISIEVTQGGDVLTVSNMHYTPIHIPSLY